MSKDIVVKQLSELNHRGLLDQYMVPVFKDTSKNSLSLPDELSFLNIGHEVVTVYAYLLHYEDCRTHQCRPSYRTISDAVHLAVSTVMKHITELADRQFITMESTSYTDRRGMKWNGNNLYTTLSIQMVIDYYHQQQLLCLET